MAKVLGFIISEFINHYKVTFSWNMSKFFPLPSPSKTCALPFDFALERDPKNLFYYQRDVENYTDQVLRFYYLIEMNIYTLSLPVCNSGQYTYVTGLCNFFFVLQDLIDRINSYFQSIAFQRNLLLVGF